jgi:hypothetical protein
MDFKQIWNKFFTTWKKIISQPEAFFAEWNPAEEWQEVIIFNVICGAIAGILTTVITFGGGFPMIIVNPVLVLIGTAIGGVILFVCFKIVGGGGDIEPTIKMVGYTQAVSVISMGIPIIGILAAFYQLWLLIVGGKAVHKLETGKAALAVLIPVVVIGGLLLMLVGIVGLGLLGVIAGKG